MEEKILAKLDQMQTNFDELQKKMIKENENLKKEIRQEIKQQVKQQVRQQLKLEMKEFREVILEDVKREILAQMFVFETEYGRKLTIAFEELASKSRKEEIQNESIANLERITEVNTAYVYNHEERIDELEKMHL